MNPLKKSEKSVSLLRKLNTIETDNIPINIINKNSNIYCPTSYKKRIRTTINKIKTIAKLSFNETNIIFNPITAPKTS